MLEQKLIWVPSGHVITDTTLCIWLHYSLPLHTSLFSTIMKVLQFAVHGSVGVGKRSVNSHFPHNVVAYVINSILVYLWRIMNQ